MKFFFDSSLSTASLILCVCLSAGASGKTVWQDNFAGSKTMEDAGFEKIMSLDSDHFELKDGILNVTFSERKPYKGSQYRVTLPALSRGEFTFEAKLAASGADVFKDASLQVRVGPHHTFFRKNAWILHRPKHGDMLPNIPIEMNRWTKFKIVFDADNGISEYYVNDMTKPVLADFESEANKKPISVVIANYALFQGTVTHQIRNMKLVAFPPAEKKLSGLIRFQGIGFYPEEFVKSFNEKNIVNCKLNFHRANFKTTNRMKIDPVCIPWNGIPRYMVMEDMPLPQITKVDQQNIIRSVRSGSTLVILGGLYTLNKGEFSRFPLKDILPVDVQDVWAIKHFEKPLNTSFGPIHHIHDLKLLPESEVLLSADGTVPLLIRRKVEKGSVIVFLGIEPGGGVWDYQKLSEEIIKHLK